MNYLIVMPKLTEIHEQAYVFPIGTAYVSASLKASGRNVTTLNLNYKTEPTEKILADIIDKNKIDVFAVGGLTSHYWKIKKLIDIVKEINPKIVILVGGGIITSDPCSAMEALETVDYGMIGEGEITICELAEALEGNRDIKDVKGIVYKEDGNWIKTEAREEIKDLDMLPYPDYDGFEYEMVLDKVPADNVLNNGERLAYVSFGRSCPGNCTFCFHPSGTQYRQRSIDSIFKEVDILVEKYQIKNLFITDELFGSNMSTLEKFCEEVKKRKLGFHIAQRVDTVDREKLILLKQSGCLEIGFGLESADNQILKSMQKDITIEQIERTLSLCQEVGMTFSGNFIFGDISETVETAENTIRWWQEHPQYTILLSMITIFPGTYLYEYACSKGIIKDKVEFIKAGCPYKNISKMTDDEYKNLSLMAGMLSRKSLGELKDVEIEYSTIGKINLSGECPHCGAKNEWEGIAVFRNLFDYVCSGCKKVLNFQVHNYVGSIAEENFKWLSDRYKVAIWPMVVSVTNMIEIMPSILTENVFFIDSSVAKQGTQYKGKEVFDSSIIEKENIEIVILTLTTANAEEIMSEIREKHFGVKMVLLAGDLVNPKFVEKMKALEI